MFTLANLLILYLAFAHLGFLVLEMLYWTSPLARDLSGMDEKTALASLPLARNQGLYNGFLAAGLFWGLAAAGELGLHVKAFFLCCAMVAGLFGGATVNVKIFYAQGAPALLALALTVFWR